MSTNRSKLRRRRRVRNAVILILVLAVASFGAWQLYKPDSQTIEYRTAPVTRGDLEVSISALGSIQPKNYVDVGAQVSGQLDTLTVEIGDRVEAGQLLAEIDPTLLEARVESSRAQLRQLEASLNEQRAQLELARSNAERDRALYDSRAISAQQLDSTLAALQIAEAKIDQLTAQIDGVKSSLSGDEANLNFTRIFAPISGTVVSVEALEGQTLNANQVAPTILTIADLTAMTVEADVSEADIARIRPGMPAYFNTLGDPDRRWEAEVRQVLPRPEIVNDVVLYKALLDVANDERILLPDMSAQVFFLEGSVSDVIKAPAGALRDGPGGRPGMAGGQRPEGAPQRPGNARGAGAGAGEGEGFQPDPAFLQAVRDNPDAERKLVMVMTDEGPRPRPVLVGLQTRTEVEIIAGLSVGDEVVVGVAGPSPFAQGGPGGFRAR